MIPKVRFYCDVDGVLNLNPRVGSYTHKERIVRQLPLLNRPVSLNLRFNSFILEELNELPLELYWLSTWNGDAVRVFRGLGLRLEQHVVPYKVRLQELLFHKQVGKYQTLLNEVDKMDNSPFIWADDVATVHYRKDQFPGRHLILPVKKSAGLTKAHLEQIKSFVSNL